MFFRNKKLLKFLVFCGLAAVSESKLYPNDELACSYAVRLLYLQDASADFKCIKDDIQNQLDRGFNAISAARPGSMFKVASFTDMPFFPFSDCTEAAPTPYESISGWSTDAEAVAKSIDKIKFRQFGDKPQAQLMAIAQAIDSGEFPTSPQVTHDGRPVKNMIVLGTNSDFHSGDSLKVYLGQKNTGKTSLYETCISLSKIRRMDRSCCDKKFNEYQMIDWDSDGSIKVPTEEDATFEKFPTLAQVGSALKSIDAVLVVLKMDNDDPKYEIDITTKHYADSLRTLKTQYGIVSAMVTYSGASKSIALHMTTQMEELEKQMCSNVFKHTCIKGDGDGVACSEEHSVAIDSQQDNLGCLEECGAGREVAGCAAATANQLLACYSLPAWPRSKLKEHTDFARVNDQYVKENLRTTDKSLLPSSDGAKACQTLLQSGVANKFKGFSLDAKYKYFVFNKNASDGAECLFVESLPPEGLIASDYRAGPMYCDVCTGS